MKTDQKMLADELEATIRSIQYGLSHSDDLICKVFSLGDRKCAILYLESLADQEKIRETILKPLLNISEDGLTRYLAVMEEERTSCEQRAMSKLLQGDALFLIDEEPVAYVMDTAANKERSLTIPINERVIRGSHLAFNENLGTSVFLIRKQLEHRQVTVKYYTLGNVSQTRIALVYLHDITNPALVERLENRIHTISADFVQTPGFIEEMIEDRPFSLFPQILYTERPDRTAAYLNEGSVALLAEGDPAVALLPVTFFSFLQTADDYSSRFTIASVIRFFRVIAFFIALILPATYISLLSYHYEALPDPLLFSLKSNLELIPYPPIVEALFMQFTLEMLREAAIRLPQPIGLTVSIVGGLVIGTTVVQANLVSNAMVVVIATTAIASFLIPNSELSTAIRIIGFPITLLAAVLGFLGMAFGVIIMFIHVCRIESLGMPYFNMGGGTNIRDKLIRFPTYMLNRRNPQAQPQRGTQERESREWQDDERS
ncbi:spore germination protein [Brevibacillus nitrificans]|nr:spore germination protein [Brevibacillus nitrificans]